MTGKRSFQNIWEVVYALLMFLLVRSIVLYLLGGVLLRQGLWNDNTAAALFAVSFAVGVLPSLARAKEAIANRAAEREKLCRKPRKAASYSLLVVTVCVVVVGLNLLFSEFAGQSESYQQVAETQHGASLIVALICYGLVTPVAEELIFRGIIYNHLHQMMKPWIAALLSALVFGVYHGNAVQCIYGFLMSVLIIGGYEYFGKFKVAVGIHMAANVIACIFPWFG